MCERECWSLTHFWDWEEVFCGREKFWGQEEIFLGRGEILGIGRPERIFWVYVEFWVKENLLGCWENLLGVWGQFLGGGEIFLGHRASRHGICQIVYTSVLSIVETQRASI